MFRHFGDLRLKTPKMASIWPQEAPKRRQDGPKRLQERPKRRFFCLAPACIAA